MKPLLNEKSSLTEDFYLFRLSISGNKLFIKLFYSHNFIFFYNLYIKYKNYLFIILTTSIKARSVPFITYSYKPKAFTSVGDSS